MRKIYYLLILAAFGFTLPACRHLREVTYFQQHDTTSTSKKIIYPNFDKSKNLSTVSYEPIIQANDILAVYVNSLSPEASSFFNTVNSSERIGGTDPFTPRSDIGYTVDPQGFILLPLAGKIKVAGLTITQARDTLSAHLDEYLQYPTVRVYLENFRVIVLGEVYRPGVYKITNEKITVPEALALAGDLTIYGNRTHVMLIREEDNVKKYFDIDLTRRDLFSMPYYYLRSNDILYVEPVKGRVAQSDNFYRIAPLAVSVLTLAAVILFRAGLFK